MIRSFLTKLTKPGSAGRLEKPEPARSAPAGRPGSEGFTLLEIMIALAIVSIALTALLSLGNRSIAVHDRLQRITQATLLAQHKMSEIESTSGDQLTTQEEENGTFDEPNEGYTWSVAYSDTPLPSIKMVTVTVSWGDENANEVVTLDSFTF